MGNKGAKNVSGVYLDAILEQKLKRIFERFDLDQSGTIEKDEILQKFRSTPEEGKEVARLFEQMDGDQNASIDMEEYMGYWKVVLAQGKPVEQISAQLDRLLDKADFQDQISNPYNVASKAKLDTLQAAERAVQKTSESVRRQQSHQEQCERQANQEIHDMRLDYEAKLA